MMRHAVLLAMASASLAAQTPAPAPPASPQQTRLTDVLPGDVRVTQMVLTPDARRVYYGDSARAIWMYDRADKRNVRLADGEAWDLTVSAGGQRARFQANRNRIGRPTRVGGAARRTHGSSDRTGPARERAAGRYAVDLDRRKMARLRRRRLCRRRPRRCRRPRGRRTGARRRSVHARQREQHPMVARRPLAVLRRQSAGGVRSGMELPAAPRGIQADDRGASTASPSTERASRRSHRKSPADGRDSRPTVPCSPTRKAAFRVA